MQHLGRRLAAGVALVAAVGLAAVGMAAAGTPAAQAAAPTQCTTTRGTVVAVDFGHWDGPIVTGCGVQPDGQPDSSGYALLHDGGFTTAGTSHDGPAFICRLGNASFAGGAQYPTAAEDACVQTPPASAYWSFWLAPPGATAWHYSSYGATGDHPVAGGVELWEFGGTDTGGTTGDAVPSAALIPQLRAQATSPGAGTSSAPATAEPTRAATPPPTVATSAAVASSGPPPAGTSAPGPTATTSRSAAAPTTTPSRPPTPTASGAGDGSPQIVAASSSLPVRRSAGSALPVVVTVVLAALLAAGGGFSLWRRRQMGEG